MASGERVLHAGRQLDPTESRGTPSTRCRSPGQTVRSTDAVLPERYRDELSGWRVASDTVVVFDVRARAYHGEEQVA
jgi:hypothetical protein